MTLLVADAQFVDHKADWLLVFEAALRVGNYSSFDEILLRALDAWLEQLKPQMR